MTTPAYLAEGLTGTGDVGQQFELPNREPGRHAPEVTAESLARMQLRQMMQEALRESRVLFDHTHPVDEYISSPGVPTSNPTEITRTWDMPERIESILAVIPPGVQQALLQLGDRYITLFNALDSSSSIEATGVVASPGAGTVIATAVVPAGEYVANTMFNIGGTAGAADSNNVGLYVNGVLVQTLVIGSGSTANNQQQIPITLNIPAGGATVTLQAIAAGSVATYRAGFSLIPSSGALTQSLVVELNGLGIILGQSDARFLTLTPLPVTGPFHIELMGWADEIFGNA